MKQKRKNEERYWVKWSDKIKNKTAKRQKLKEKDHLTSKKWLVVGGVKNFIFGRGVGGLRPLV